MIISPHKENHLLVIPPSLGGGNFAKLNGFPGFTKWQDRNLVVRISGANLQYILNSWPDAEWIGGAEEEREKYLKDQDRGAEVARMKSDPAIMPDTSDYKYKRQPMAHQQKAFALSRDAAAFGLFMEQGTGKTKVVIDTACYLFQKDEIDALIIVAWPNGVHRNWVEYELPQDMSVPYIAEYWTSNYKAKHRQAAFAKVLNEKKKLRVFTFNIEAFTGEHARSMILKMLGQWRCMMVIDQSASIKNPTAQRTKFLIDKCSGLTSYRRVLDGAPVAEGADELYSQFKFLDPMIIGHDTWTGFKAEFCKIGHFNEITGYQNLDELRRRIDGHCYRVLADECLDLPERIYKVWPFDLSDNERRIFDELKGQDLAFFDPQASEDSDTKVPTGGVSPVVDGSFLNEEDPGDLPMHLEESRALVKNLRLQQISSGWWPKIGPDEFQESIESALANPDDEKMARMWQSVYGVKMIEGKGTSRIEALKSLLLQADGKAIIFSRFVADLELIKRTLGDKAVSYRGNVKEEDRAEAKRRFMNDPKILYFIGQPRSAGIGHTLTAAKHVIFYNNDSSLRMREECEKRAHRMGLKWTLHIWDLIARKTHDIKIVNALRSKKQLSNEIMKDPTNFFLCHDE